MKPLLIILSLTLAGCAHRAYYPNGKVATADYTNFQGVTEIRTKDFHYRREGTQDASTPTRTTLDGARGIILSTGAGAITAGAL